MAFSVAPTSGVAPYNFSASFLNSSLINGVNYNISIGHSTANGSCPLVGASIFFNEGQINTLLSQGSVLYNTNVGAGFCRTFTLSLFRVSDGAVIETSTVYVDNVQ